MVRASITKDESNILVAIGKIETQMDGLRVDVAGARAEIKEINTGITARLLNLESNAVSRIEVTSQVDDVNKYIGQVENTGEETKDKVESLSTKLEAYWRVVAIGGSIVVAVLGALPFLVQFVFPK